MVGLFIWVGDLKEKDLRVSIVLDRAHNLSGTGVKGEPMY
jgi:hypothetical protein